MRQTFSRRPEIIELIKGADVTELMTDRFRASVLWSAIEFDVSEFAIYPLICKESDCLPDYSMDESENIPAWPRMWLEISECEWFHVLDIVEALYRDISNLSESAIDPEEFAERINAAFIKYQLPWRLDEDGDVVYSKKKVDKTIVPQSSNLIKRTPIVKDDDNRILDFAKENEKPEQKPPLVAHTDLMIRVGFITKRFAGTYQGSSVTADDIYRWLDQFQIEDQSLMTDLLEGFRFFNLHSLHEQVRLSEQQILEIAGLTHEDLKGTTKKLLVCPFGNNPVKSSYALAKIFCERTKIRKNSVVEASQLEPVLLQSDGPKSVVFIDDIIGTGKTISKLLKKIDSVHGPTIIEKNYKIIVCSICATTEGIRRCQETIDSLDMPVHLVVNEIMPKCFSPQARIFKNDSDRLKAMEIARRMGSLLDPSFPLGFEDGQLLVAFADNCPNNTLPIFWKNGNTNLKWNPLLERISS